MQLGTNNAAPEIAWIQWLSKDPDRHRTNDRFILELDFLLGSCLVVLFEESFDFGATAEKCWALLRRQLSGSKVRLKFGHIWLAVSLRREQTVARHNAVKTLLLYVYSHVRIRF